MCFCFDRFFNKTFLSFGEYFEQNVRLSNYNFSGDFMHTFKRPKKNPLT